LKNDIGSSREMEMETLKQLHPERSSKRNMMTFKYLHPRYEIEENVRSILTYDLGLKGGYSHRNREFGEYERDQLLEVDSEHYDNFLNQPVPNEEEVLIQKVIEEYLKLVDEFGSRIRKQTALVHYILDSLGGSADQDLVRAGRKHLRRLRK